MLFHVPPLETLGRPILVQLLWRQKLTVLTARRKHCPRSCLAGAAESLAPALDCAAPSSALVKMRKSYMLLCQPGSEGHDDCEQKHIVRRYNRVRSDNTNQAHVSTK